MTTAGQVIKRIREEFNDNEYVTPEDVLNAFGFHDVTTEECYSAAYNLLRVVVKCPNHPIKARVNAKNAIHAMGCHV